MEEANAAFVAEESSSRLGLAASASPAVPVMTGTHFHALDEKGRVIIPAKLRPALTEQFWLTLDENDNVAIYNYQTGLDVLAHCESMMADYPGDESIAWAVERITSTAEMVSVEGNWRVPISELLRFHAQLEKEIVTVGVLNHAVLWSREKWEAAQLQRQQSSDVRRAQAQILRAAASGIRKKAHEQAKQAEDESFASQRQVGQEPATFAPDATGGRSGSGGVTRGAVAANAGKPVAPAGDGKRSPRVLALSQLGR